MLQNCTEGDREREIWSIPLSLWITFVFLVHISSTSKTANFASFENVFLPYSYFLQSKHYYPQNPQGAAQEEGDIQDALAKMHKLTAATMQTLVFVEALYPLHVFPTFVLFLCSCRVTFSQLVEHSKPLNMFTGLSWKLTQA